MTNARWTAALAALALALTACAGTDDTDGDPVAAEEPTEEVAPSEGDVGADDAAADESTDTDTVTDDATEDATEEAATDDEVASEADADVDRVVEIDMGDMFFSVEEIEFTVGERVRFDFRNVGQAPHEALIGDMHLQEEHEEEMAAGDMDHDDGHDDGHGEGHHEDVSVISLASGESGSLVHHFTAAGELWMGCHVPGHWPAGMRTRITVTE